jgi:glycosyltransferase involved in cell wall biosynthesis
MPVLEALAAGIPTACSNIAPLEEIASGAAITFDPGNEEAIAEAMEHLAAGGQAGGGVERARMYSWETAARLTLDALTIRDSPDTSSHRV